MELLNPLSRYIIDDSIRDGETAKGTSPPSRIAGAACSPILAVTFDGKANRLVVHPNHESMPGMDVDDSEDGMDVEIEELD